MKKLNLLKLLVVASGGILIGLIAIFAADWLFTAEAKAEIFRIFQLEGNVQRYQPTEKKFIVAEGNMGVELGEQLLTDEDSWVRVQFFDSGTSIHVDPLSSVAFQNEGVQEGLLYAKLRVDIGNVYVVSAGNLMVVETPQGIAYADDAKGVFHVKVDLQEAETVVVCLEGDCSVMNDTGLTQLASGEMTRLGSRQVAPVVDRVDQGTMAGNVEEELQNTAEDLVREANNVERQVVVHSTIIDGLSNSLDVRKGNGNPVQADPQKTNANVKYPTATVTAAVATASPTSLPTENPTLNPTVNPTTAPTIQPTGNPTTVPTSAPTVEPTAQPTTAPTAVPTEVSGNPDKLKVATIVNNGGYKTNPGMGWQYPGGTFPITDPAETVAYAKRSAISWQVLNPAEGVYDWSALDSQLNKAVSQGKQFSFRVYTMRGEDYGGYQVPQWVLDKGAVIDAGEPVYSNCVYQEEWGKFVNQLIKRYDGNPHIAFVDISGYGNFNEWSWRDNQTQWDDVWADAYASGKASPTTMSNVDAYARRALVDMFIGGSISNHQCVDANNKVQTKSYSYGGFKNTQLVMPYAGIIQTSQYVFTRSKNIGFRYDCLGRDSSTTIVTADRFLNELNQIWPKAPVVFETCPAFSMGAATTVEQKAHASFIHNINQPDLNTADTMTLMEPLGYRYELQDFRYSYQLSPGDNITVQMKWQNTGLAPYYPKLGIKLELHVYYYDSTNSLVKDFLVPANLAGWMPASTYGSEPPVYTVDTSFTAGNEFAPGEYYADVKIIEVGSGKPIWTSTSIQQD